MIGVTVPSGDVDAAGEFFELFKTPWEPAVPGRQYEALVCTEGSGEGFSSQLIVVYNPFETAADRAAGRAVVTIEDQVDVEWRERTLPIYAGAAVFEPGSTERLLSYGGNPLDYRRQFGSSVVWRIGYDLFREVRHLLSKGQSPSNALKPTLDWHIALLRTLLLESGVPFVEIPPRPFDNEFICCLTHDVDFFGLRRHRFDLTLAGFLARASVGTLADVVRRRRPLLEAARNWRACLTVPLVFLSLTPDFWSPFDDYAGVEDGRHSTFFVVPFKGRPGIGPDGRVKPRRAVPYQATEIRDGIAQAASRGSEVAVHGIDAWRDSTAGRAEMQQVVAAGGQTARGVRMHWLYFAEESPRQLEDAGFAYDSSCGFNEAVGYRAGTLQAFRFPGTSTLMELPMAIMDTALFYRHRMGLSTDDALRLCRQIVAHADSFGGALVINWHERSLAPERLWGRAYAQLVAEVCAGRRVWFTTAGEAVEWFRWRRSIRFARDTASNTLTVTAAAGQSPRPAALMRVHRGADRAAAGGMNEIRFDGSAPVRVQL